MGIGYGTTENIECIQDLATPGPKGETLCLAYKYSYHQLMLPAYVSNDGYVLSVKGTNRYYPIAKEHIADEQKSGMLPDPMPAYSLSPATYLYGFSLWPLIALVVLIRVLSARRMRSVQVSDNDTPISTTPASIVTPGDHFIHDQVASQLKPGEAITHQVYGTTKRAGGGYAGMFSAATNKGVLAAATADRLFLIQTRVGAFKPLLENRGMETLERSQIREIVRVGNVLTIVLASGDKRTVVVLGHKKYFSGQAEFLRDVPRIFTPALAA